MPLPDWWADRITALKERDLRAAELIDLLGIMVATELNGQLNDDSAAWILSTFSREPWRLEGQAQFDKEYLRVIEACAWHTDSEADPEKAELDRKLQAIRRRLHSGVEVCAIPPPTPLVDGLLFTPGESVLYSPPGAGKTFMALDLALSVATGLPFMGHQVHQSPVLYVAAEGVGGLGARVAAWCHHHQQTAIDQAHFLTVAVNLSDPNAVDTVAVLAVDLGCRLVVLDTLARCMVGVEENSAKEMGQVVQNLDRLRDAVGHVHGVHHMGKDTTKGMRGSTALLGAVDTTLELTAGKTIQVAVTKQKDAEPLPGWKCHLVPVDLPGLERTQAVIRPLSGQEEISQAQEATLRALAELPPELRTASKWQLQAEAHGVGRTTFYKEMNWLLTTHRVHGGGGRGALYTPPDHAEVPDEAF